MYQIINASSIRHLPSGTVFSIPAQESFGHDYQAWLDSGNTPDPAPLAPIADRRSLVWEQIKEERARREAGGIQAGGHWFQTDSDSRIKFLRLDAKASALIAAGGQSTDILTVAGQPIYWKTTENGLVPMTAALAQGIMAAVEILDALAYGRAEVLRAQVMASDNPESIDITTGWPTIYED